MTRIHTAALILFIWAGFFLALRLYTPDHAKQPTTCLGERYSNCEFRVLRA